MPKKGTDHITLQQRLLEAGAWMVGPTITQDGREFNNRLDISKLSPGSWGHRMMISQLFARITGYKDIAVWGISDHGRRLVQHISGLYKLPVIHLARDEEGQYRYRTNQDRDLLRRIRRAVGVVGATTNLAGLDLALNGKQDEQEGGQRKGRVPGLREATVAVEAVWRLGTPETERELGTPIHWLVEEPIPPIVTPDHPLLKKFGHLAVPADWGTSSGRH